MENFLTILQVSNNGKFSKLSFLNKIKKGQIVIHERNFNHGMIFCKIDSNLILKLSSGLRFNAKYNHESTDLEAYLGTSFNYKFTVNTNYSKQ